MRRHSRRTARDMPHRNNKRKGADIKRMSRDFACHHYFDDATLSFTYVNATDDNPTLTGTSFTVPDLCDIPVVMPNASRRIGS
jgi:hypothetical protein